MKEFDMTDVPETPGCNSHLSSEALQERRRRLFTIVPGTCMTVAQITSMQPLQGILQKEGIPEAEAQERAAGAIVRWQDNNLAEEAMMAAGTL